MNCARVIAKSTTSVLPNLINHTLATVPCCFVRVGIVPPRGLVRRVLAILGGVSASRHADHDKFIEMSCIIAALAPRSAMQEAKQGLNFVAPTQCCTHVGANRVPATVPFMSCFRLHSLTRILRRDSCSGVPTVLPPQYGAHFGLTKVSKHQCSREGSPVRKGWIAGCSFAVWDLIFGSCMCLEFCGCKD